MYEADVGLRDKLGLGALDMQDREGISAQAVVSVILDWKTQLVSILFNVGPRNNVDSLKEQGQRGKGYLPW